MRRALPLLATALTFIMLFQAGGASLSTPRETLQPTSIPVEDLDGVFPDALLQLEEPEAPELPAVIDPPACRPPELGSVCLDWELEEPGVLRAPGPLPVDPYDLVPVRVSSVEDWRPLVEHFFRPGDVDRALRIMYCESKGDPNAKNRRSSASGLFQHLTRYWPKRAAEAGFRGASVFDPVANTAASAMLVYEGGGWSHWTCR